MINGLVVEDHNRFEHHPFKEWVAQVLNSHFAPAIADRFSCVLEVEKYNKKNKNIVLQLKDQKYVMEVYYTTKAGIYLYICDLFSDWPRKAIEAELLRKISDKVVKGEIGKDWIDNGQGRVSEVVLSGKLQTPDEVLTP